MYYETKLIIDKAAFEGMSLSLRSHLGNATVKARVLGVV